MSDEGRTLHVQHRMGEGAVDYLTSSIYEWALFMMSFFGMASAVDASSDGEVRKQIVVEVIILVVVLFLYLYLSIFL